MKTEQEIRRLIKALKRYVPECDDPVAQKEMIVVVRTCEWIVGEADEKRENALTEMLALIDLLDKKN